MSFMYVGICTRSAALSSHTFLHTDSIIKTFDKLLIWHSPVGYKLRRLSVLPRI